MPYIFDTSALVHAWVRAYPPDLFPAVWARFDDLAANGDLLAPEEVLTELAAQDDDLYAWLKERESSVIVPTSRGLMLGARAVLADHGGLTKTGTGRGRADPFVIALGELQECPVVTQEVGGSRDKPRIPFVCAQRSVRCLSLLEVIRTEAWRF